MKPGNQQKVPTTVTYIWNIILLGRVRTKLSPPRNGRRGWQAACKPYFTVMKHNEPKCSLKSGLITKAVSLQRYRQTNTWEEKTGHPTFYRGWSFSGLGICKGHGLERQWWDLQVKRISQQERGLGGDSPLMTQVWGRDGKTKWGLVQGILL